MSEASVQEVSVQEPTLDTQATQDVKVEVVKRPRTELQVRALEAARQKALEMRAQKKLQKETEKQSLETVEKQSVEEAGEEVEYVRKARSKPKAKKRVIVVEESSSSEDEVEIRLPKRRSTQEKTDAKETHFERSMQKMFSL